MTPSSDTCQLPDDMSPYPNPSNVTLSRTWATLWIEHLLRKHIGHSLLNDAGAKGILLSRKFHWNASQQVEAITFEITLHNSAPVPVYSVTVVRDFHVKGDAAFTPRVNEVLEDIRARILLLL